MTRVIDACDPETYEDARGMIEWDTTMAEEYKSSMKNNTLESVPCPKGKNVLKSRWVYKNKFTSEDVVERYYNQLVANGFSQ
jgi:hypothetical protein